VRQSASGPSIVKDCLIACGTDDAFELDGAAAGILVSENTVHDCYVGLSISPVLVGPVEIRQNQFLLDVKDNSYSAGIKLLPPAAFEQVARNIQIVDNLFVSRSFAWWRRCMLEDFQLSKNVVLCRESIVRDLLSALDTSTNRMEVVSDFPTLSKALSAEQFRRREATVSKGLAHRETVLRGVSWRSWSVHPALAALPESYFAVFAEGDQTLGFGADNAACPGAESESR
jgi:hypothetical protein